MTICHLCGARIVFARTLASENGTGGKQMPLDPKPNPGGNVAVRRLDRSRLVARVLGKGETHDTYTEQLYMPHFASCAGTARSLGAQAEAFLAKETDQ